MKQFVMTSGAWWLVVCRKKCAFRGFSLGARHTSRVARQSGTFQWFTADGAQRKFTSSATRPSGALSLTTAAAAAFRSHGVRRMVSSNSFITSLAPNPLRLALLGNSNTSTGLMSCFNHQHIASTDQRISFM